MKIKKILVLLSMLICSLSLTACSDGQGKVEFNYTESDIINYSVVLTFNIQSIDEATKIQINNTEGQEVYQTAISNFETAEDECGRLIGLRKKDGSLITLDEIVLASQDEAEYGEALGNIEAEVYEDGDKVRANLTAVYEKRDVRVGFLFVAAPKQASIDQMTGEVIIPFDISEITVSPEYSFKETMSQAAMNTLMGMGTVFAVLIIIAIIIGQFEWLSKVITKVADAIGAFFAKIKERRAEKKAAKKTGNSEEASNVADNKKVSTAAVSAPDNLINDSELVAVITAAIMASEGQTYSAGSDGLIVRSIKKAKR